jgi:hypothetical protein
MFYITLCKLLFGMYQKVMLLLGIVVALICVVLGFLSVIGWNIVAVLATVSMGIPSLILAYEKTTSKKHIEPKQDRIEQGQEIIEEKVILSDETIRVGRDFDQYLDFELGRGDNLKGEISSDSPINIYFVDNANFKKWSKDRNFDYEYCSESVLETKIDYEVPKKGVRYLLLESDGRKSALVKIYLYLSIYLDNSEDVYLDD